MDTPLILAGFMGAGKTTVGQIAARRLGFSFVDTDAEIERREGLTIPQVFDLKGEAYFRAREAELARELAGRPRTVIATGGGMAADPANRRLLIESGVTVCLTAAPEAILRRVDASTRPMLRGGDPRARVAQLLKERAPAYAELRYHVDTTHRLPEEVAECIIGIHRAEQRRIRVAAPSADAGGYDIVLGGGLIDLLGFAVAPRGWSPPLAIVSDDTVGPLYAERAGHALERAGLSSFVHLMRAGEAHKTLHSVEQMYQAFAAHGLERNGAVVAVGGGVVGDVAGFAAATYLRGVAFIQVPTTLLAMADSSVGGKVGVDTDFGKNLVGAFKQPDLVVMDRDCLGSLPEVELQCGYAEIVKAALIAGGAAWERVKGIEIGDWRLEIGKDHESPIPNLQSPLTQALVDAILLKRDVVQEDPYERGRRALLNLGHTFGHGIEAWSGYTLRHGQAVALGMVCAARLSQTLGLCGGGLVEEIVDVLDRAGLPVALPDVDLDAVWNLMQSDKKKRGGRLRFVVLRAPGDTFVTSEVSESQARDALRSLR